MKLFNILFFIVTLYPAIVNSQVDNNIIIKGTVFDNVNKEPLPYASISLSNNKISTASNINGEFRIIIPYTSKNDSIRISYLGYKTTTSKISELPKDGQFFLIKSSTFLEEVVVVGLTAQSILEKAILKIPDNYYTTPYKSKGFYRLTAKKEGRYIRLSEASFELYHSEKKSNDNQLKLKKMREIKDEQILNGMEVGASPKEIFDSDVINNIDESGFLDKKGLKEHTFKLEPITSYNNKEVYVLSFDQKDGIKKAGYCGKLFIDTETFAIIHLNYGLSTKSVQYHKVGNKSQRILMDLLDIHLNINKYNTQISYKKVAGKYYLSSVHVTAINHLQSIKEQFNFNADLKMDYLITTIEVENCEPFTIEEILNKNKYIEKQNSIYNQKFWEEHNVILPNFDFSTIAKNINAKNKTAEFKTEIEDLLYKYPKDKGGRIDSIISFYNKKGLFNGNALVSYDGEVIFQKSYNNTLTKNHQNTQFRIGSTSKTFTSMLIMLLENEGKLNISDSIGEYLPEYIHKNITIEQLLTHQSGIPNYTVIDDYLVKILRKPYPLDELITSFCSDPLEFEPGSKFQYSNSGYLLLSLIIKKITDQTYATILKEKIFDKLKMDDSYFGEPIERTNLATAYQFGEPEGQYFVQNVSGAGGITSTVEDLLKWSNAMEEETLLPKEKMQELFISRANYSDWEANYGYGWMLDRYMFRASKKHQIRYHPGTELGFYSMFLKQPDKKISIILLSNTGNFPRFPITDLILNELN